MGAFGGFLGGLGQGVQNQQQADGVGAGGQQQQQGSSGGGSGLSSMFGGQWGILPIIQKALSGGQTVAAPSNKPTPSPTSAIPSPTAGAAGAVQPNNTINTQNQQSGFHGLIPMAQNYYHNHQAKQQDAVGQTHLDALQDPNVTPEQRQYHYSGLQQTYANRPDVLKQLGLPPAPGSYNVPSVGTPAAAPQTAGGSQ